MKSDFNAACAALEYLAKEAGLNSSDDKNVEPELCNSYVTLRAVILKHYNVSLDSYIEKCDGVDVLANKVNLRKKGKNNITRPISVKHLPGDIRRQ